MCTNKTNKSKVCSVNFSEYTMFRHLANDLSIIEKCTKYNFKPQRKNCTTIRPLLSLSRFETGKFCAFWQLPLYPDRSNQKVNFLRNRVRKQLLPTLKLFFNSRIETLLLQFAEIVEVENLYMNQITNKLLKRFFQANTQPHFFETETLFSPISLCTVNCLQKTKPWLSLPVPTYATFPFRGSALLTFIGSPLNGTVDFPLKGTVNTKANDTTRKPMTQWVAQGKNKANSLFLVRYQCHSTKCPGNLKSSQPFNSGPLKRKDQQFPKGLAQQSKVNKSSDSTCQRACFPIGSPLLRYARTANGKTSPKGDHFQQSQRHYSQSEYESKPRTNRNDVSIESRQNKDKKNGKAAKPNNLQFLSPRTIEKWCVFRPKMLATYKNTDILHPILVFPRFSVPIKASFWVWNRKLELGTVDSLFRHLSPFGGKQSEYESVDSPPPLSPLGDHAGTVNREMNKWGNSSIIGVECSLLSTSVKELTHGMLSPKISLTKPGRKKSSIFSKAISGLNISHNKKMNTIFIHNFFFHFNTLELKRKEIYWPIVISFLPLALQRRTVKLFLLNQNWKNIRYSQIENFLAIQKNFSSHYLSTVPSYFPL